MSFKSLHMIWIAVSYTKQIANDVSPTSRTLKSVESASTSVKMQSDQVIRVDQDFPLLLKKEPSIPTRATERQASSVSISQSYINIYIEDRSRERWWHLRDIQWRQFPIAAATVPLRHATKRLAVALSRDSDDKRTGPISTPSGVLRHTSSTRALGWWRHDTWNPRCTSYRRTSRLHVGISISTVVINFNGLSSYPIYEVTIHVDIFSSVIYLSVSDEHNILVQDTQWIDSLSLVNRRFLARRKNVWYLHHHQMIQKNFFFTFMHRQKHSILNTDIRISRIDDFWFYFT